MVLLPIQTGVSTLTIWNLGFFRTTNSEIASVYNCCVHAGAVEYSIDCMIIFVDDFNSGEVMLLLSTPELLVVPVKGEGVVPATS